MAPDPIEHSADVETADAATVVPVPPAVPIATGVPVVTVVPVTAVPVTAVPRVTAVPVVTRGGHEPDNTGQSAGASRISGVSPQHTPATRLWFGQVRNEPGYRSVPHHHGEAETGGYVLAGRARIYFGAKFADYIDMNEGDWVFVPPFLPHVECNLDRNRPLTWMTARTPDNIVVNLAQVPDDELRDWLARP